MESEKENMRKNNSDKNLNRMTRHQSHPINDMNIKKELLSYDPRQSEKKPNNKKINEEKCQVHQLIFIQKIKYIKNLKYH